MLSRIVLSDEGDVCILVELPVIDTSEDNDLEFRSLPAEPTDESEVSRSADSSDVSGGDEHSDASEPPHGKTNSHRGSERALQEYETVEVVVDSAILCKTSPMFKKMLKGPFKEAKELADHKAVSVLYQLDLTKNSGKAEGKGDEEDDNEAEKDGEATLLLLRLVHYDLPNTPERLSVERMERLAVVCDYYQCTHILKYCGAIWAKAWLELTASVIAFTWPKPCEDLCRVIAFTYAAGLSKEFNLACWLLIMHYPGQIGGEPMCPPKFDIKLLSDHRLLPKSARICWHIEQARSMIQKTIGDLIIHPFTYPWDSMGKRCFLAAKCLGVYSEFLQTLSIFPSSHIWDFTSLYDVTDMVASKFKYFPPLEVKHHDHCNCNSDISQGIHVFLGKIQDFKQDIMCLDCIKTDGASQRGNTCKVSHRWYYCCGKRRRYGELEIIDMFKVDDYP
ncbi:hypothetical protein OQA88_9367 [Cercophora sp. LCS_1]